LAFTIALKLRYLVYFRAVLWHLYKDKIIYSSAFTIAFGIIIFFLNKLFYPSHFWDAFPFHPGVNTWFCEYTDMHKLVRQPINTFTNAWYLVNSIFFFSKGLQDYKRHKPYNLITANPFYSLLFGGISMYTFVCSTFFHASLIEVASTLDFSAVYSISLFPLMYLTHRLWMNIIGVSSEIKHLKSMGFLISIFTILYLLLTFAVPMKHIHETVLVFIICTGLMGIWLERKEPGRTNRFYLNMTLLFIAIAILFFKLDMMKVLCQPESFLQPHSIWHLCNGIAILYFYLYIRSEKYKVEHHKSLQQLRRTYLND